MSYIMVRVDGELIPISDHILKPEETYNIIRPMMTDTQWKELEQKGELDFAYTFPGFSVCVSMHSGSAERMAWPCGFFPL